MNLSTKTIYYQRCFSQLGTSLTRYPCVRSSSVKTAVAPCIFCKILFTVGIWIRIRFRAVFAFLMSTTRRTSPYFFGITTRGDNHGVAPATFSIIPCLRISSSLLFTTCFMLCGMFQRAGCATGVTVSSIQG